MAKKKQTRSLEEMSIESISSSSDNEVSKKQVKRRSSSRNKLISYKEASDEEDKEETDTDVNSEEESICSVEENEITPKSTPTPTPSKKRNLKKESDEKHSVHSVEEEEDEYPSQNSAKISKSITPATKKRRPNTKNDGAMKKDVKKEKKGIGQGKLISLPDSWPVSSTLPQYMSKGVETTKEIEDSSSAEIKGQILTPGPALIECSGNDILLKKGVASSMKPNLDKMKGKYLIILPGMLTLNSGSKAETNSNTAATPQSTMQLGRLEKLHTDTPTLNIPLPNNKLVFQGRKINSTSKFLSLKCTPGTNRSTVDCNGIFTSVIVFSDAAVTQPLKPEISEALPEPSQHYGGSCRTIDGGKQRKKSNKTSKSTLPKPKKTKKVEVDIELSSDDEEESDDEIELLSSDDDDEEFDMQVETTLSPRKITPKRSSSAKKPVTYKDIEDSDEDNDDNDDDYDETSVISETSQPKNTPNKNESKRNNKVKADSKTKHSTSDDDSHPSDAENIANTNDKKPKQGRSKTIKSQRTSSPKPKSKRIVSLESKSTPTKGRKKSKGCSIELSSDEEDQCDTKPITPTSRFRKGRPSKDKRKKNLDASLDDSEFNFIDMT